jgi:hypothetical protein
LVGVTTKEVPVQIVRNILLIAGAGLTNGGVANQELAVTQATVTFFTLANFIGTAGVGNGIQGNAQPTNITPLSSSLKTICSLSIPHASAISNRIIF